MSAGFLLYFKLIGSVLFWGGTWIAGKILAGHLSPYNAGFLRFFFASFFMFFMVKKFTGHYPRITKKQFFPVVILGATGVFLYNILFFTGLETVEAGRASLIIAGTPTVIAISSALLFKEKFTFPKILGFIISLTGVALVIARGNPLDILHQGMTNGDLCILGCVVTWAAYSIAGKKTVDIVSPVEAVAWSCFIGTVMLLPFAISHDLFSQAASAGFIDWASLLYLAIMGTGLAFSWYYEALQVIGASKTGIFINLVPVTAVVLGYFCFGELMGPTVIAGGALVIGGVWITNRN
jgi:drug/metabolite transporter (DMT)-like permease